MERPKIRSSLKIVWAMYFLAATAAGVGICAYLQFRQNEPIWLAAIPLILLLAPVKMHVMRRLASLRLQDSHLTFETGFFSRMRRTVDVAKIQDVTVRRTFSQRVLGTGDILLESAGERGSIIMRNVDRPRQIADSIIAASKQSPAGLRPGSLY
jgi:uncharacterized membrane protein YdbT with pleckstrin-like domain